MASSYNQDRDQSHPGNQQQQQPNYALASLSPLVYLHPSTGSTQPTPFSDHPVENTSISTTSTDSAASISASLDASSTVAPSDPSLLYLSSEPAIYHPYLAPDTAPDLYQHLYIGDPTYLQDQPTSQSHLIDHNSASPSVSVPPSSSQLEENSTLGAYSRIATAAGAASSAALSRQLQPNMNSPLIDTESEVDSSSQLAGIYSSSGFDIITLLAKVINRPSPQINIGPVDLSCSFVVCDAQKVDMPIVYCSKNFENLTGYTQTEIVGRNCRFLQAPDGEVSQNEFRKFTDNNTVRKIKDAILRGQETQAPLLNYRKGGHPFVNMLTIVPVTWESSNIAYFIGFQIDLGEQPQAILNSSKLGSYDMNYRRAIRISTPIEARPQSESVLDSIESASQIVPNSEPTLPWNQGAVEVLGALGIGDPEVTDKLLSKAMLINSEDLVYVVTLRGVISFCSPSSKEILEYQSQDLIGTNLSELCHPSDVVNMTRDLKEVANNPSQDINTVFRIRRKHSGYCWLESYGRLFNEAGKARRCIVMIGRERPVYYLNSSAIMGASDQKGLENTDIWVKLSPTGIILFASSSCQRLLGYKADDMFSKSIQSFSPDPAERAQITQAIGAVFNGVSRTEQIEHSFRSARGEHQPAVTVIYTCRQPEDLSMSRESTRPHFVLARIRIGGSSLPQPRGRRRSSATTVPVSVKKEFEGSNLFAELETTRSTSWQYELRQMQLENKKLKEECDRLMRAQGHAKPVK
ncbi:PAS domain-containing protein [Lipomyces arxii]|uniref:PAS domain-containing protein n=1 Tax=Lipomyces arxii TaxID=56418 RepID=UPI0034CEA9A1